MQLERKSDFQVGAQYVAQLKKKTMERKFKNAVEAQFQTKNQSTILFFYPKKKYSKCSKSATGAQLKNATHVNVCQSECNFKNAPELNLSL